MMTENIRPSLNITNLAQSTLDYNKPVIFAGLRELVETTETATDVALSRSATLLQQLMNRQLYEWVGVDDADDIPDDVDTDGSEDDGEDSTLEHDADSVEKFQHPEFVQHDGRWIRGRQCSET